MLLSSSAGRVREVSQEMTRELQVLNNNPFGAVPVRTSLANQEFLDGFSGTGLFIEALNQFGRPIGKSSNLGTNDLPTQFTTLNDPRIFGSGGQWAIVATAAGRLLINKLTISSGSSVEATVLVAESLDATDSILKRFRGFLLLGLAVALSFIALASLSLARAALGPIGQITRAAQEITGDDLGKRYQNKRQHKVKRRYLA